MSQKSKNSESDGFPPGILRHGSRGQESEEGTLSRANRELTCMRTVRWFDHGFETFGFLVFVFFFDLTLVIQMLDILQYSLLLSVHRLTAQCNELLSKHLSAEKETGTRQEPGPHFPLPFSETDPHLAPTIPSFLSFFCIHLLSVPPSMLYFSTAWDSP